MESLFFNNCFNSFESNDKNCTNNQLKDENFQTSTEYLTSPKSDNQFFSNDFDFSTNLPDESENIDESFNSHIFDENNLEISLDDSFGLNLPIENEVADESETNKNNNINEKFGNLFWNGDQSSFVKTTNLPYEAFLHQKKALAFNSNRFQSKPRRPDNVNFYSNNPITASNHSQSPESITSSGDSAFVDCKVSPTTNTNVPVNQYNSSLFRPATLLNYQNNCNDSINLDNNNITSSLHTSISSYNNLPQLTTQKFRNMTSRVSNNSVGIGYVGSKMFQSPIPQTGVLMLTEEEKRTMVLEGFTIPTRLPLTKQEERNLKKVRRKIKNKISAQESRRKKKEYMEALEKKVEYYVQENTELKRQLDSQENLNRSLVGQLRHMQQIVTNTHQRSSLHNNVHNNIHNNETNNLITKNNQGNNNNTTINNTNSATTCLMICCLCFSLLFFGSHNSMNDCFISRANSYISRNFNNEMIDENIQMINSYGLESHKSRHLMANIHKVGYGSRPRILDAYHYNKNSPPPSNKMQRYRSIESSEQFKLFQQTNGNNTPPKLPQIYVMNNSINRQTYSRHLEFVEDKGLHPIDSYSNVPFTTERESVLLGSEKQSDEECIQSDGPSYFQWLFQSPLTNEKESTISYEEFVIDDNISISTSINNNSEYKQEQSIMVPHSINNNTTILTNFNRSSLILIAT